eukprot:scaffold357_cov400-Prasinococcus_capsulatus_cf.AAC.5
MVQQGSRRTVGLMAIMVCRGPRLPAKRLSLQVHTAHSPSRSPCLGSGQQVCPFKPLFPQRHDACVWTLKGPGLLVTGRCADERLG